MRLTEAQLRDTIRAPGWDSPEVGRSVWAVRRRGVSVRLLDDGGLDAYAPGDLDDTQSPGNLARRMLVVELTAIDSDGGGQGSVTARILPPGREVLASIVVDVGTRMRRVEIHRDGRVSVDATSTGGVDAAGTPNGPVAPA
ncbi:hypothetical protein O4158_15970 [Gordonia amicalis]|uniref:hypothetical protein n=1 Tax=Gordonia amicalis TaxID=89053 RepID=UPI0022B35140|nr:hypothetical protein [Gordonia amicalis]MCZ4580566.1 hypothetical protein [Gordonia amicalis]